MKIEVSKTPNLLTDGFVKTSAGDGTLIVDTTDYVESVVAGTNITVDNTDPSNPIVNSAGGGGGGQILYDILVDPSGDGDYTNLEDAFTAVLTGQTIFVKNGTYTLTANDFITPDGVNVFGENNQNTIINVSTFNLFLDSDKGRMSNLAFTGTTGTFRARGDFVTVDNCVFNYAGTGNFINWGGQNGLFTQNYFFGTNTASNDTAAKISFGQLAIRVTNNHFQGSTRTRALISLSTNNIFDSNNVVVTSSIVSTSVWCIEGIATTIISNSSFEGVASAPTNGVRGGHITDNRIQNFYYGMGTGSSYNTVNITGNKYLNENSSSIPTRCIDIGGSNIRVTIANNNLRMGSQTNSIGINSTSTINAYNNHIVASARGIVVTGTNSIVVGNYIQSSANQNVLELNSPLIVRDNDISLASFISLGTVSETVDMSNNRNATVVHEHQVYKMKNTSGGTINAGSIVVHKSVAVGDEITTTTTAGDNKVFGMACANILNNAFGLVNVKGKTALLKANGTTPIVIGDFLSTHTSAGIVKKAVAGETAIAIALEAYSGADDLGILDALIISPRLI